MFRQTNGDRRPPRQLRRARLATATLFFANGCGLGSWLPHIPDVKIWHGLSDGVLGLALLARGGAPVLSRAAPVAAWLRLVEPKEAPAISTEGVAKTCGFCGSVSGFPKWA